MLVLTRKEGESIVIQDEILIKVIKVQGKQVRIGIEAPPAVHIYREEIKDAIAGALHKSAKQGSALRRLFHREVI